LCPLRCRAIASALGLGHASNGGQEGFAVDWLASGSGRAARRCRHFGTCGGCALQHLDDASYRRVKLETLHTALEREQRTFAEVDQFVAEPFTVADPRRENEDGWARRA
jgi:23S rRNA (uracil1939-C5)-methyltransferase